MATISNTPRPGYVWDSTDNCWYPIGVGNHNHSEIQKTIVDAKGDLIVGTANDTVARLAVGTDGQMLYADSTQTGGVKWAAAPSSKVLQVVSSTYSTTVTTTTQSTWTATGLSASITPSSTSSKILVLIQQSLYGEGIPYNPYITVPLRLKRDSTEIVSMGEPFRSQHGSGGYWYNTGGALQLQHIQIPIVYSDSPSSTSALTYTTEFQLAYPPPGAYQGSASAQYGSQISSITLMEIGA